MKIIFIRHGEPDYARDCLTPLGHEQARAAAKALAGEGITAVYASPMGRAQETAKYTADALGLPIQTLPFLHEIRWGSADGAPMPFDGHPWSIADELTRQGWDLTRADWPEHPLFARNLAAADSARVGREADAWLETLGYLREGNRYRKLDTAQAPDVVALFCHGGSSTAVLAQFLGLPFPYLCAALHLSFCGILSLVLDPTPSGFARPWLESISDGEKGVR